MKPNIIVEIWKVV